MTIWAHVSPARKEHCDQGKFTQTWEKVCGDSDGGEKLIQFSERRNKSLEFSFQPACEGATHRPKGQKDAAMNPKPAL